MASRRVLLLTVLVGVCGLSLPGSAVATSAADRAATDTYLHAAYTLALAFAHNRSAADAAEQRAGAAIAAECPKVLAGAPGNPQASQSVPPTGLSPRAEGEKDRQRHQFSVLTGELETTLRVDAFTVDSGAFTRFVETVAPLRWSDPAIARSLEGEISIVKLVFEPGPAGAVCSDMRAWVASDYRTLSTGTLAFEARQEGLLGTVELVGGTNPERELKRYEGPGERALAKRTEAINSGEVFESGGPREAQFRKALGIEETSVPVSESKGTVIGHGVAQAGGRFTIEVSAGEGFGPKCGHVISYSYTVKSSEGSSSGGGSGALRCLSGGVPKAHPEVRCEEGAIEVLSTTMAATRDVRLALSDGRTIVSRPIPVAKRYGGPAGVYFQAVPGPSPYPVSLSELDAAGRVLRSVPLRAVKHCRQPQPSAAPIIRDLVRGRTPAGQSFTITAASSVTNGHRSVSFFASGLGGPSLEESQAAAPGPAAAKYFPWTLTVGCQAQTESIIYGQLKRPGTTVLVATATTPLSPLTEVPLPAALKLKGTLAYALRAGVPTELVVRGASGAVLVKEDLMARAKRETEYCEGYAEPAV